MTFLTQEKRSGRHRVFRGVTLRIFLAAVAVQTPGCMILRKATSSATAPMARDLAASLQTQSDLELVHDGSAAFLLLLDGMLESGQENPDLLIAAAHAQVAYASAFVPREEAVRARAMYAKARDYGLRALRLNRRFNRVWDQPFESFASALPSFKKRDVPALYITANAWAGWIVSSPGSMEAVSQFSKARALMERVLVLDPGYQSGGADLFFGVFFAVQPRGGGQDLARAKDHFERAMQFAGPDALLPHVMFAEFYARNAFDRALFEKTLNDVLAATRDPRDQRLMNAAARRRARDLLDRTEDFF